MARPNSYLADSVPSPAEISTCVPARILGASWRRRPLPSRAASPGSSGSRSLVIQQGATLAGFLIATYSHILRSHTKPADLARGIADGSILKPKQWEFLEQHAFTGFDNDGKYEYFR